MRLGRDGGRASAERARAPEGRPPTRAQGQGHTRVGLFHTSPFRRPRWVQKLWVQSLTAIPVLSEQELLFGGAGGTAGAVHFEQQLLLLRVAPEMGTKGSRLRHPRKIRRSSRRARNGHRKFPGCSARPPNNNSCSTRTGTAVRHCTQSFCTHPGRADRWRSSSAAHSPGGRQLVELPFHPGGRAWAHVCRCLGSWRVLGEVLLQ